MSDRTKLVILGTGFAGFSLLKDIDVSSFDPVVVSPRNHFLFTPLLPSTTVGTIEFRSIVEPIRAIHSKISYYQAYCNGFSTERNAVQCVGAIDQNPFEIKYDILVVSVGAVSNTYGIPGVTENALFLKELSDARLIRQRIISCFEQAAQPSVTDAERKRLLHFVVVGGGPTGVEFAAEMHDFLKEDLVRFYPELVKDVDITILEAGSSLLGSFDSALSQYAMKLFLRQRIKVQTRSPVVLVDKEKIVLADKSEVSYGLLVWSTGLGPTHFVQESSLKKDRNSRILTDHYLKVLGTQNVYAIGDCAAIDGLSLPATAQVAQQEGIYLAKALLCLVRNKTVKPFRYRHFGMLAYVGGNRALADLGPLKGRGFLTWLFWRSVYLTKLVSLKNKILVPFDWIKTALFGRDISWF